MTDELDPLLDTEEETEKPAKAIKLAKSKPSAKTATEAVVSGRKAHWPKGFVPSGDKIADTKAILDASPKVPFMIPLEVGETAGAEEIVQINGYKLTIKKGHMVEIPTPVVEVLARKYRIEMEVASRAKALSKAELS